MGNTAVVGASITRLADTRTEFAADAFSGRRSLLEGAEARPRPRTARTTRVPFPSTTGMPARSAFARTHEGSVGTSWIGQEGFAGFAINECLRVSRSASVEPVPTVPLHSNGSSLACAFLVRLERTSL